jgi:hypothetical protein
VIKQRFNFISGRKRKRKDEKELSRLEPGKDLSSGRTQLSAIPALLGNLDDALATTFPFSKPYCKNEESNGKYATPPLTALPEMQLSQSNWQSKPPYNRI